ncbi:MAG TPA: CxxC-x17-CxxC domain-containing protein [Planctomycetota bacterium]
MSAFADKQIKCIECNKDFTYTAAEQELHKSLGYQNEPKRCNPCREAKRQRRPGGRDRGAAPAAPAENGAAPAVAGAPAVPAAPTAAQAAPPPPRPPQQNRPPQQQQRQPQQQGRGGRDGGRRGPPPPPRENRENRGGPGPGADPGFAPREFFLAICAECGKEAQLPFKPRGDRPVLCIECFAQKRTG